MGAQYLGELVGSGFRVPSSGLRVAGFAPLPARRLDWYSWNAVDTMKRERHAENS